MGPDIILIVIIILLFSVVIHEVAHGYAALWLGDNTAQYAGRLTLNPLKHLDWFGSVILPILLSFSGFVFGWAKPVPYNPYNLKNRKWGELLVAVAGPASNLILAIIFGLFIRLFGDGSSMTFIAILIVQINVVLAVFNLVPIPPLDGSKILFAFLPPSKQQQVRGFLEKWGFIILIFFIVFMWGTLSPIINFLVELLTGVPF